MLNLTQNEKGEVLLADEPIVDWFKKRGLAPCIMSYVRTSGVPRCCLAGAMGVAAVEDKMSVAQFETFLYEETRIGHPLDEIAEVLGIDRMVLAEIEAGYMLMETATANERLGVAARHELFNGFDTLEPMSRDL